MCSLNYHNLYMISGEWTIRQEKKMVQGHIDIPEFSFGELDELQVHCTSISLLHFGGCQFLEWSRVVIINRLVGEENKE